jgi:hypothetical protein
LWRRESEERKPKKEQLTRPYMGRRPPHPHKNDMIRGDQRDTPAGARWDTRLTLAARSDGINHPQGTYNGWLFLVYLMPFSRKPPAFGSRRACRRLAKGRRGLVLPRFIAPPAPLYGHGTTHVDLVRWQGFGAAAQKILPLQLPRAAPTNRQAGSGRAWQWHRSLRMQKHMPSLRRPAERVVRCAELCRTTPRRTAPLLRCEPAL